MVKITTLWLLFVAFSALAQEKVLKAPEMKEGDGPYTQLIIRGVTLIDGTGAPPIGPTDIVIKQNKIVSIQTVGYPGVAINAEKRPKLEPGGKELDCEGMYVMPGFIDMHGHPGPNMFLSFGWDTGLRPSAIHRPETGWIGYWIKNKRAQKTSSPRPVYWPIPPLDKVVKSQSVRRNRLSPGL
jgi:hypothetical protein